ncbi:IS982 family transposase [Herpetosiphon llansteffanensis]|uniref:IS982 family transposase n=1 Tax=Herpetosiphon llansteffanensis TaxID=2094568 RepID=UPI000D7CAEE7|nr:IS982 family transposase [Herpetosiphon llansteffanensis]
MSSIPLSDVMTILSVLVDDWYQASPHATSAPGPGPAPALTPSEVLTILLAMDVVPFPSERSFLGFLRATHGDLFPTLPHQSQFNRHARRLCGLLEPLRRSWLAAWATVACPQVILDTKPIPVVGYRRSKRRSDFAGSASYGYCASRNLHYFGYKLVMLTTLDGIPVAYDLVPAHTDERAAADEILDQITNADVWSDTGFLGEQWHHDVRATTKNRIWTAKRRNQPANPVVFDRLLGSIRERIEGTFHELQNTGRNVERLLAKTVEGLATRIASKVTHLVVKAVLRARFGIDVLTFTVINDA